MSTLNLEQFSTHFQQLNFKLLFTDVLGQTESVLEAIYNELAGLAGSAPSPLAPLPEGEGDRGTPRFPAAFMRHDVAELDRFPQEGALWLDMEFIRRLSPGSHSVMEFKSELDVQIAVKSLREENQLTYAEDNVAQHEPKIACSIGLINK